MTLQFPTMAEKAVAEWRSRNKTKAFNTVALAHGATRDDENGTVVWVFDDDTRVVVKGRGKNHSLECELP